MNKKLCVVFILVSFIFGSVLSFGINAKAENLSITISKILKRLNKIEKSIKKIKTANITNTKSKVYTGSIDINQAGDYYTYGYTYQADSNVGSWPPTYTTESTWGALHWKRISIPQLNFDKVSNIKVLVKPHKDAKSDIEVLDWQWVDITSIHPYSVAYGNSEVDIMYKIVNFMNNSMPFITGEYKIMVSYLP